MAPPATSTLPETSTVAVCAQRGVESDALRVQLSGEGAVTVTVALPCVAPPALEAVSTYVVVVVGVTALLDPVTAPMP
jgi:hypothetical protein